MQGGASKGADAMVLCSVSESNTDMIFSIIL